MLDTLSKEKLVLLYNTLAIALDKELSILEDSNDRHLSIIRESLLESRQEIEAMMQIIDKIKSL
tara:strand:- start:188 stop:379 length:192 start_codon:yes stop_codon:yes gene_type:complete